MVEIELNAHRTVASLTLSGAGEGNRLDRTTLGALGATMEEIQRDEDGLAVLVVQARGPDFCLGRMASDAGGLEEDLRVMQSINRVIAECPLVTIAAVQGRAYGAGLSLAGRCDLLVAERDARLAFPEVAHGVPPTFVLSHFRDRLSSKALLDLVLTGREVDGAEAVTIGLASRVAENGEAATLASRLAEQMSAGGPAVLRAVKEFLALTEGMDRIQASESAVGFAVEKMGELGAR